MKFRMLTTIEGCKVAVNVDAVQRVEEVNGVTLVFFRDQESGLELKEDFQTAFSRLNTML